MKLDQEMPSVCATVFSGITGAALECLLCVTALQGTGLFRVPVAPPQDRLSFRTHCAPSFIGDAISVMFRDWLTPDASKCSRSLELLTLSWSNTATLEGADRSDTNFMLRRFAKPAESRWRWAVAA
jgi:hypothetical protein